MHLNKPYNSAKLPRISLGHLVMFLIWPFAVFVRSLRRYRIPQSKTIFWLFCIYFGLVFIVAENYVGSADSARYALQLKELHRESFSFSALVELIYSEVGYVDIYQPLLTWIVASFTNNPKVLFALFAAVFGFFYVQNLWMVLNSKQIRFSPLLFLFVLALALTNPIWNINGARMWTATHIFLYGVLHIYLNQNKKGYLWAAASILVHFSFLFPVALLIAYAFIPKNATILFVFFVSTSFVNEINYEGLREVLGFLPETFQPRVRGYTNEQYAEQMRASIEELSWHVRFADYCQKFVLYLWTILAFAFYDKWSKNLPKIKNLFLLGLFIGGFAKIAGLVPSGGRFLVLSNFIFCMVFIFLIAEFTVFRFKVQWAKQITYLPLTFYLIFAFRTGMDYYGPLLFVGNPLFALVMDDQIPLIEFIKSVF
ncbi:EpsG family protein [Schleiferia thermophila]|uniref:EpsG-like putative glucosyltransferase n=1 Tax=Schleiferia thermophila TaxID=884107 RepID=A0A369A989_9FLAO|nr:EpsG family protein [Schleiferia thermophila]RCX05691.1 EpsG-like putative glucosyltransferase [Schleiferia thermophila]